MRRKVLRSDQTLANWLGCSHQHAQETRQLYCGSAGSERTLVPPRTCPVTAVQNGIGFQSIVDGMISAGMKSMTSSSKRARTPNRNRNFSYFFCSGVLLLTLHLLPSDFFSSLLFSLLFVLLSDSSHLCFFFRPYCRKFGFLTSYCGFVCFYKNIFSTQINK